MAAWIERKDRRVSRPSHLVAAAHETPPPAMLAPLVLQQVTLQLVYCILLASLSSAFRLDAETASRFMGITLVGLAVAGGLQAVTKGPVGAGYAVPLIPAISMVAPYLLAADVGASLEEASLLTFLAGLIVVALFLVARNFLTNIPTEVGGVITFGIGASLVPRALQILDKSGSTAVLVASAATIFATVLLALLRSAVGRFAMPLGALLGVGFSFALGVGADSAAHRSEALPWVEIPLPLLTSLPTLRLDLLPAFVLGAFASLLALQGGLVSMQRAGDASWKIVDRGPIGRGLLAGGISVAVSGGLGAVPPGIATAGYAMLIQARVLSRMVVLVGGAVLVSIAFLPRLAAMLASIPEPVQGAMLLYMACFVMAGGCQSIVARMLDTRRIFVVGLALVAVLATLIGPKNIMALVPLALQPPVMAAAFVGLLLHFLTLPLVTRRVAFTLELGPGITKDIDDRCRETGGAWGARREPMLRIEHALIELSEAFAARGLRSFDVQARYNQDVVQVEVRFVGPPLAWNPGKVPTADDLLGSDDAQEAFTAWMALKDAEQISQESSPDGRAVLKFTVVG